jgi:hypothetical protein
MIIQENTAVTGGNREKDKGSINSVCDECTPVDWHIKSVAIVSYSEIL